MATNSEKFHSTYGKDVTFSVETPAPIEPQTSSDPESFRWMSLKKYIGAALFSILFIALMVIVGVSIVGFAVIFGIIYLLKRFLSGSSHDDVTFDVIKK